MYKQGQHLTEVVYEFKPNKEISVKETEVFITEIVKALGVTETHRHLNILPPGFDILCGLKESCLYFGYWAEHNYVRFMASSCKQFNKDIILNVIKKYFKIETNIYVDIRSDEPIKSKVEKLWH